MSVSEAITCVYNCLVPLVLITTYIAIFGINNARKLVLPMPLIIINIYYVLAMHTTVLDSVLKDISIKSNTKTIITVTCYLLLALSFKAPIKERLKAFLTVMVGVFFAEMIVSVLYAFAFKITAYEIIEMPIWQKLLALTIQTLLYALAGFIACKICTRTKIKADLHTILLIGGGLICFCLLSTTVYSVYVTRNDKFALFSLVTVSVTSVLGIIIVAALTKQLSGKRVLAEKLYWINQIQGLESDFYLELEQKSRDLREIRHDIKDNLEAVKLLVSENTEESRACAGEIIDQLSTRINNATITRYTQNIIVNTIVSEKITEAQNIGAKVTYSINLPQKISGIESIDLSCLFINLLSNAVEAARRAEPGKRKIDIKATVKNNSCLIIKTENSFDRVERSDGGYKTTKQNKSEHGIGLVIIENIVKKYSGTFRASDENSVFTSVVTIPLNNND